MLRRQVCKYFEERPPSPNLAFHFHTVGNIDERSNGDFLNCQNQNLGWHVPVYAVPLIQLTDSLAQGAHSSPTGRERVPKTKKKKTDRTYCKCESQKARIERTDSALVYRKSVESGALTRPLSSQVVTQLFTLKP